MSRRPRAACLHEDPPVSDVYQKQTRCKRVHTDPEAFSLFDKTSPTANIESVYTFLALAQHKKMWDSKG